MRIRSYRALRPVPSLAGTIASLPYDVVTTSEARELAAGNPLSMLRVVRADLESPDGTDPYSEPVYARARENFDRLVRGGHLERESAPALYIYRQQLGSHRQTGVAALCHVDDYDAGVIKKHENTRPDKENDRTRLTALLRANPGPIFLAYRDRAPIDARVAEAADRAPLFDFTAPDRVHHTVWRVEDAEALVEAFAEAPCAYVADGHHRAASAARVARECRAANPGHRGDEDYNWFLTVLFPATQVRILPYNRLVADLRGLSPVGFLDKLGAIGTVRPTTSPSPTRPGVVCFYLTDGAWRELVLPVPKYDDPVSRLDVSVLQDSILGPVLGIDDPRTDERIDFAGGIRGTKYLEEEIRAGRAAVAFSM